MTAQASGIRRVGEMDTFVERKIIALLV